MAVQTINGSLHIKKDENTVLVVEGITQEQKTEVQDLNSLEGDKLIKASAAKTYVDSKVQEVQQGSANKAEIVFVDNKPEDISQYNQNQIVIFPTA